MVQTEEMHMGSENSFKGIQNLLHEPNVLEVEHVIEKTENTVWVAKFAAFVRTAPSPGPMGPLLTSHSLRWFRSKWIHALSYHGRSPYHGREQEDMWKEYSRNLLQALVAWLNNHLR
ncbi:hypothetical protein AYI69_g10950 [Smittium culicis]|uniref:Uncharacterized protein n=1 Tax=Smittium culicis TaxID=133412 RepID=A0A1R1X281_9FUNG|nr:hypothetical protein AYI69_g10950 [Smittium culicis]